MQASPKLIFGYWDIRGLGQSIRYLLEYLNVPYEEIQYIYGGAPDFSKAAWFSVKHTLGFDLPNIPYIIDDGFQLTESHAIYRYLANKYQPELLGKTIQDKAAVDMFMSFVQDIRDGSSVYCYDTGDLDGLQKFGWEKFAQVAKFLTGKEGFIAGGLSIADFILFEHIEMFQYFLSQGDKGESLIALYPVLGDYHKRFANLEGIKEYLESDRCIKKYFCGKRAILNNN
ncbi:hypothetical protein FGO68_gene16030 [Halteria grandinella]|uniref:glutathione transferase n=1 Tax=Halteria grandinella TaxID=5974 RepID=A0A8J8NJ78_HALGN|nr:hypothetical protein FGO68_gene16030 [Halteria grandinella]